MNLFKDQPDPKEVFDRLIWDEEYAEALAYAIDNGIEREALKICIEYIQEDDERTERELQEVRQRRDTIFISIPKPNSEFYSQWVSYGRSAQSAFKQEFLCQWIEGIS